MPNLSITPVDLTNREDNRLRTRFIEKINVKIRDENTARTQRNQEALARDPNAPQEPMQAEYTAESYASEVISKAVKDWVTKDRDEESASVADLWKNASDAKRAAAIAALQ